MGTRASGAAEKVPILFVLDGFPKELFESSVVDGSGRPSHVASEAVAVGDLFLFYFFGVASFAVRAATFSALLFYPRLQPDLPAFQRHDVFQLLGALLSLQLLRLPSQEFPEVLLR